MDLFECPRCHYHTEYLWNLKKHLLRKKQCPCTYSSKTVDDIFCEIEGKHNEEKEYKCEHCGKKLASLSSKSHHKNKCKVLKVLKTTESLQMKELQDEMKALKDYVANRLGSSNTPQPCKTHHQTNNIVQQNNIINIIPIVDQSGAHLREFDQENMDALPYEILSTCLMNLKFRQLLENLHFDQDFPENHNVRLKSIKRNVMEIYKNNKWDVVTLKSGLTDLIEQGTRIFNDFARRNREKILQEDMTETELEDVLQQLRGIEDKIGDLSQRLVRPIAHEVQSLLESHKSHALTSAC